MQYKVGMDKNDGTVFIQFEQDVVIMFDEIVQNDHRKGSLLRKGKTGYFEARTGVRDEIGGYAKVQEMIANGMLRLATTDDYLDEEIAK